MFITNVPFSPTPKVLLCEILIQHVIDTLKKLSVYAALCELNCAFHHHTHFRLWLHLEIEGLWMWVKEKSDHELGSNPRDSCPNKRKRCQEGVRGAESLRTHTHTQRPQEKGYCWHLAPWIQHPDWAHVNFCLLRRSVYGSLLNKA